MAKYAYMTIDDAPSADTIAKADLLFARRIPAVWFVRGDGLERDPDSIVYAIGKGFVIGNHSFSHSHFGELTLKDALNEIKKTDDLIEAVYKKAKIKRPAKYFRFPYGERGGTSVVKAVEHIGTGRLGEKLRGAAEIISETADREQIIQEYLKSLGYSRPKFPRITYKYYRRESGADTVDWRWTYHIREWAIFKDYTPEHKSGLDSIEAVLALMDRDDPEHGYGLDYAGSDEIVVLHDHPETTKYFEPILDKLLAKGLTFIKPE